MKKVFILASVIFLSACAVNVPFQITKSPEGTTDDKRYQDDRECHALSQKRAGASSISGIKAKLTEAHNYKKCMTARGYTVEMEEDPNDSNPNDIQSVPDLH
ncbi:MAG: hypothetical protein HY280_02725 [Nitrospinae bacterium]|nr:hypothetical protein [Nitrospinota bacterium]